MCKAELAKNNVLDSKIWTFTLGYYPWRSQEKEQISREFTIHWTIKAFLKCKAKNPKGYFNSVTEHWKEVQNIYFPE